MKQKILLITLVTVFVLACSLGGKMGQKSPLPSIRNSSPKHRNKPKTTQRRWRRQ